MAETLGICVSTSDKFWDVLGIATAAHKLNKEVEIFFTGDGVRCTQNADFKKLIKVADVAVCEVSYLANGFKKIDMPELGDKKFMTQARHAEMVEECERYLII